MRMNLFQKFDLTWSYVRSCVVFELAFGTIIMRLKEREFESEKNNAHTHTHTTFQTFIKDNLLRVLSTYNISK